MTAVIAGMLGGRSGPSPADWSRRRKAALVAFALLMTYLHSLYILGFYVSELEYWWPFWTGMTVEQRLLSYALALFANFGLIAMPFVRAPDRVLRTVIVLSLTLGLLISLAWLTRDLWVFGLLNVAPLPRAGRIGLFLADVIRLTSPVVFRALFTVAILLNFWFLLSLAKRPKRRRA